jgi:hypothetical protein
MLRFPTSLHRQIIRLIDLGEQTLERGIKYPDAVLTILLHEAFEVRAAEFPTNRGHLVPRSIFKPSHAHSGLTQRTAYRSLSLPLRNHRDLSGAPGR